MIENVKKSKEHVFEAILPGGVGEFVHEVGSIYLRIPVDEVKNIQSAIVEAENEGLNAKVINSSGYEYLEIYKEGYDPADDTVITEKVKKVAKDVSKEDYLDHIENLQLTLTDEKEWIMEEELEGYMPVWGEMEAEKVSKDLDSLENPPFTEDNHNKNSNIDMPQDVINPLTHIIVARLVTLCNFLDIPIVSSVEELKKLNSNSTVIYASKHGDYNTEPKEIKEILLQKLENGKKTIVGFEFLSDFEDVLNDPAKNLKDNKLNSILSMMKFKKTLRGLIEVFNEIQQKYSRDRFEIKPFDVTYSELLLEEDNKKRDAQVVKNILDLLRTYEDKDKVIWTGMLHVIDLLKEIERGEIDKDHIVVFLHREYLTDIERK